jgi:hypothetical protein
MFEFLTFYTYQSDLLERRVAPSTERFDGHGANLAFVHTFIFCFDLCVDRIPRVLADVGPNQYSFTAPIKDSFRLEENFEDFIWRGSNSSVRFRGNGNVGKNV